MIEARGLTKRYGRTVAVDALSFDTWAAEARFRAPPVRHTGIPAQIRIGQNGKLVAFDGTGVGTLP